MVNPYASWYKMGCDKVEQYHIGSAMNISENRVTPNKTANTVMNNLMLKPDLINPIKVP
jgi:hypothetical protein